jgi:hypothetical protein
MSTLNVSNITDGTDTVETGYVLNGSAKAWSQVNQESSHTINDSFNVSSVSDDGTGKQTSTFTSAFNNSNYVFQGTSEDGGGYNDNALTRSDSADTRTTTQHGCWSSHGNSTSGLHYSADANDSRRCNTVYFGELA